MEEISTNCKTSGSEKKMITLDKIEKVSLIL